MTAESDPPPYPEALRYIEAAVGEDPPRHNAFRILGLSIFDDVRAIRRRQQLLSMRRFKDFGTRLDGPLPPQDPVTAQQVAQAVHRLRAPACRLVDELFWFWPDEALAGLAQHPQQVLTHWRDREESQSAAWQASRNLGVFYLAKALDYEFQTLDGEYALTAKQSAACVKCWKGALLRWRKLRDHDAMWTEYRLRVEHFNDPRFPGAACDAVRHALDEILLRGLIALAIRSSQLGHGVPLDRCLAILGEAGFGDSLRRRVGRKLLGPIVERIRRLLRSSEQAVADNPEFGTRRLRELVDETEPSIRLLETILPADDMLTRTVCDELCLALLQFQVRCTRETDDWADALQSLRIVEPLAKGKKIRGMIEKNIDIVSGNLSNHLL